VTLADAGALRVLLSTAPDETAAARLARALVEEKLAACVNVVPGVRSTYRWQGALEQADEFLLVVKTTAAAADLAAVRLAELHPYDVPEVLVFSPTAGAAAYLAWVAGAVQVRM
jgi:periplasmic divalent cation tolerance protein